MADNMLADLLAHFNKNINDNTQALYKLYDYVQHIEADKTPRSYRPYVWLVKDPANPTPRPLQILGSNPGRASLTMYNYGSDDIIYSNTWFDPLSITKYFSDPNSPDSVLPSPNQNIEIGFLPSGASVSIDTVEATLVYNIGGSGAVLSIIESLYGTQHGKPQPVERGLAGVVHQGYGLNGQKVLR